MRGRQICLLSLFFTRALITIHAVTSRVGHMCVCIARYFSFHRVIEREGPYNILSVEGSPFSSSEEKLYIVKCVCWLIVVVVSGGVVVNHQIKLLFELLYTIDSCVFSSSSWLLLLPPGFGYLTQKEDAKWGLWLVWERNDDNYAMTITKGKKPAAEEE